MDAGSVFRIHASLTAQVRRNAPTHPRGPISAVTSNTTWGASVVDGFDHGARASLEPRPAAAAPLMSAGSPERVDAEARMYSSSVPEDGAPGAAQPMPQAATTLTAPTMDLVRGMQGPAVKQLQDALVALGHMTQAAMSTGPGIFGPRTEAALQSFQRANGVPSTGYYGPLSRSAMQGALGRLPPSSTTGASPSDNYAGGVGAPTGPIRTLGDGTDWSAINRWDPIINSAAQEFGVPADLIKAMMVIESRGNPNAYRGRDGTDSVPAVGLMQIKPAYWAYLVPDADPYSPEGNVRIAAALLRRAYNQHGSWEAAITNVYFPVDDVNGTSQRRYLDLVRGLRSEIQSA